ncbi:unnamed protein product [Cochlearia groenlandica]
MSSYKCDMSMEPDARARQEPDARAKPELDARAKPAPDARANRRPMPDQNRHRAPIRFVPLGLLRKGFNEAKEITTSAT